MYRYLFLTMFSLISLVEGSFRSMEDHGLSHEKAKTHPGLGAAVLVIVQSHSGDTSITNGTYVAPGKVLTHAHEQRVVGKTWVMSPFAGCTNLPFDITLDVRPPNFECNKISLKLDDVIKSKACKRVKSITYPEGRSLIPHRDIQRTVGPDNMDFVDDYEQYIQDAVVEPSDCVNSANQDIVGTDFCILDIDPFPGHPVAQFYPTEVIADTVSVFGYSLHTHVCDGSDSFFDNTLRHIAQDASSQGIRGKIGVTSGFGLVPTSFTQSVRKIFDSLVAEAVVGKAVTSSHFRRDEIFDKERTNPEVQAVIVGGLSGSGVYIDGMLVGLVSRAHKSVMTEGFEKIFSDALKTRNAEIARVFASVLPAKIPHPLLNIHQIVTAGDIDALLSL